MKNLSYVVSLATITATILLISGAAAINLQDRGGMPPSSQPSPDTMLQRPSGSMDMSAMKQEPHHLLAMAYRDNLVNFANLLGHQAAAAETVDPEFARAATEEMRRSFDHMQAHHQGHIKAMDEHMKPPTAEMKKHMDAHHLAIREFLAALHKEVQTSAPDSKSITGYVAKILKHCEGMTKMHGGMMEHKMAAPQDRR